MSDQRTPGSGTPLWGGRFEGALDPGILAFTNSLPFDRRLGRHDLIASLAHARMLYETEILSASDAEAILGGLSGMLDEVESGELGIEGPDEDVHSWIERTLGERIGEPAGRLHTARSRNDQTGIALRLYVRARIADLATRTAALQDAWIDRAAEHLETWMPGYTHLQRGQPISLAHHLMAHAGALEGDLARLRAAHAEAGRSPLGAGALAGTSFPIDPARGAALLGMESVYPNSLLAVSDRDYVAQTAFACALLMTHLSRWADEVILWTTSEFGFATLDDSVSQGSSIMPQKRNPEAAEILRGKSARAIGAVTSLLALLKGLPFAFNSDLQEDKEPLFDALDTARASLSAALALTGGLRFEPAKMAAALRGGMLTATALADQLVRSGVPFRAAHERAGQAVREAERRGIELWELPPATLAEICPETDPTELASALEPEAAGRAHASPGGPAPERVTEQIAAGRGALALTRGWLANLAEPPILRAQREDALLAESIE